MNGILLVNKPKGMTSHDVVNKLRRILHMKKIGHTGTLDPNAEGVLMVLLGNSCKILPFIKNDIKEYVAKMTFGYTSDTLDIWGNLDEFEVEKNYELRYIPLLDVENVLKTNAEEYGDKKGIAREMIDLFGVYKTTINESASKNKKNQCNASKGCR